MRSNHSRSCDVEVTKCNGSRGAAFGMVGIESQPVFRVLADDKGKIVSIMTR